MKIDNAYLQDHDIREEEILYFPNGIIGFETIKKFILVSSETYQPFSFLISPEQKDLTIPVINPFLLTKEYQKSFPTEFSKELGALEDSSEVFCVVNPKSSQGNATLNLKGPILINYLKKTGKQVILNADILTVSFPLN